MNGRRLTLWTYATALTCFLLTSAGQAHQSACHRWHSCPSDTGSYVCGDLGQCSQCPDNEFCQGGRPRAVAVPRPESPRLPAAPAGLHLVRRVIDGDTIQLDTGERVRLIGVDTPETKDPRRPVQHFGREATAFTRRMVEGRRVRLEFDWTAGISMAGSSRTYSSKMAPS